MKCIVFTFFFILLFLTPSIRADGNITMGIQPSFIEVHLTPSNDRITIPLKIWNQGSDNANFTLIPFNLTEFTDFTTTSVIVKGNTTRTSNYTVINIVFKRGAGNKTADGGIYVKAEPLGEAGVIKIIPQILMRIRVIQTSVDTGEPPYSSSPTEGGKIIPTTTPPENTSLFFPILIITSVGIGALIWWWLRGKMQL
jgi:hypothetical protein